MKNRQQQQQQQIKEQRRKKNKTIDLSIKAIRKKNHQLCGGQ